MTAPLFTASVADATLAELLQAHLFQVFVGRFGTPAGRKTMNEAEVGDLCHVLGLVVDPGEMIALYGKHGDNMFLQFVMTRLDMENALARTLVDDLRAAWGRYNYEAACSAVLAIYEYLLNLPPDFPAGDASDSDDENSGSIAEADGSALLQPANLNRSFAQDLPIEVFKPVEPQYLHSQNDFFEEEEALDYVDFPDGRHDSSGLMFRFQPGCNLNGVICLGMDVQALASSAKPAGGSIVKSSGDALKQKGNTAIDNYASTDEDLTARYHGSESGVSGGQPSVHDY